MSINDQHEEILDNLSTSEIKKIEVTIEEAEAMVQASKDLKELEKNPLFKSLITERYMKDEAVRLVHLKADSQMNTVDNQRHLDGQIAGIGFLGEFMRAIYARGMIAEKTLLSYDMQEVMQDTDEGEC